MPSSANRPENGGISFRVPEEAQGWRLDKALGLLLASPSPEQEAARPGLFALADLGLRARRRLCDRSLVLVNGKPGIPGLKLRAGQEIIILPDPEGAAIPKDAPSLVYKDGGIAALYKPAGMHTAALAGSLSPSLETLLGDLLPSEEEGYASRLLNRLDAPTSGLVLASCTDGGERRWYRAERIGNTDKLYLALKATFDDSFFSRLAFEMGHETAIAQSWLIMLLWVIPFSHWNNAYSMLGFAALLVLFFAGAMPRIGVLFFRSSGTVAHASRK